MLPSGGSGNVYRRRPRACRERAGCVQKTWDWGVGGEWAALARPLPKRGEHHWIAVGLDLQMGVGQNQR